MEFTIRKIESVAGEQVSGCMLLTILFFLNSNLLCSGKNLPWFMEWNTSLVTLRYRKWIKIIHGKRQGTSHYSFRFFIFVNDENNFMNPTTKSFHSSKFFPRL